MTIDKETAVQKIDSFMSPCELDIDDKKFLLNTLPSNNDSRKDIANRYKAEFLAGMRAEPRDHVKQNAGGRRANAWLAHYNQ
jgi:hypothetical protein